MNKREWIKMRPSLYEHPKVLGIARYLDGNEFFKCWWAGRTGESRSKCVTEEVTEEALRFVTLGGLLRVWGAANVHAVDGTIVGIDAVDVDSLAGIWGFGAAMERVGWLIVDSEEPSVTFVDFETWNVTIADREALTNAERQARHRQREKDKKTVTKRNETSQTNNEKVTLETETETETETEEEKPPIPPKGGRAKPVLGDSTSREVSTTEDSSLEPKPRSRTVKPRSKPRPALELTAEAFVTEHAFAVGASSQFRAAWAEWVAHRIEKKRPLTERSAKMSLKKLRGWDVGRAVAAIEHSIANGYQGIFEPDGRTAQAPRIPPGSSLTPPGKYDDD